MKQNRKKLNDEPIYTLQIGAFEGEKAELFLEKVSF
jgi:hypothetical protein